MSSVKVPHIVVIDPGVRTPEIDTFNHLNSIAPLPCTYHLPAMFSFSTLPDNLNLVRAVIVMGSAASVNDDFPWQRPLEAWVKRACEATIPVLGLCYGHQMLAHMFGGRVEFMYEDRAKLKGLREIQLLENPVWISTKAKLVVTHAEAVVALPECMSALATSEQVRIDGLQHKTKPVFGFQSHPEATVEFLKGHEMLEDQAVEALVDGASIMGSFMSLVHKFRG